MSANQQNSFESMMKPEELKSMTVEALLELRRQIDSRLSERKEELIRQLEQIDKQPVQAGSNARQQQRIAPRYKSRIHPHLVWSGRGVLPKWMRAEMKGTKLTKDDFRI